MKKALERLNITRQEMEDTAFELYVGPKKEAAKKRFREILERELNNINIQSLLWAGIMLQEKIEKEMPELNEKDPCNLVADEILGMNIANYINGTNAIFEFYRYDRKKPGILSKLDPFIDDIIGGLIAGIMSRIYEDIFDEE
ncbi:alpha-ribazole phosphatase CobZ [Candidatus Woesearchaeota archaeon]|nr:alpha-ribazole phosphatase CobZ [Candidatus Woesearchaeota archaeon]